jgi:hypothetical protein
LPRRGDTTESQLRIEVANLKAKMENQNETLSSKMSKLERINDENGLLNANLKSVKDTSGRKITKNDELTIRKFGTGRRNIFARVRVKY